MFAAAKDVVAVISDWSDEPGATIIRNLRKDGDYYLYKKGTMRSYWGALKENSLGNFLSNEWIRMGGMDLSDVGYDAFLINGRRESQLVAAKKGETVRVRLINAGASSYFHVGLAGLPFRVIAADGLPVVPIDAREILMGMAETYDLVFQLPDQLSYELRATAQDGTGFASAWIGDGEKRPAPDRAPPSLYEKMEHGHHGGHGGGSKGEYGAHGGVPSHGEHTTHAEHASHAQHMGHGPDSAMGPVTVDRLENPAPSQFPADSHFTELKLVLNGDMFRYIWHINGRAIFEERNIEVKEGDVVRFIFENQSMMHHPMHLHGHFFRVVTEAGPTSPIKHTVDVPPHGTRVIEFRANEPGLWMLHCHNLYHMHSGMARVVKYMSYEPRTEVLQHAAHDPHNHDHLYTMGSLEGASNHAQLHYRISSTWNEMELRLEARERSGWDGEGDLFLRRWIGNYLSFFAGATTVDRTFRGLLGVSYLLPFLLKTQLSIDTQGEFRLDLARKFQWTSTIFTEVDVTLRQTLESEFEVSLLYGPVWWWAAGLMVTESSVGAGARIQF
ncbi:MAG: multicopper oxidase domain-containing protein [Deltaproteobacteria bacterium]|nr:multicopper oxidase domain-containing protein [Deltaproteobacteria bacterium]